MNIGIFGLSGVGKTFLASKFVENRNDFILTRASKLIKDFKHDIKYQTLNESSVNRNQLALIKSFELFKENHPNKNILIELHNIIETPNGPIPIDDCVFEKLKLDAACFISRPPKEILIQRSLDLTRERSSANESEIEDYQHRAIALFKKSFMRLPPSRISILNSPSKESLEEFIGRVT